MQEAGLAAPSSRSILDIGSLPFALAALEDREECVAVRAARVVIRSVSVVWLLAVVGVACSDGDPPLASPDLQCDGEASGTIEADLDPSAAGAATADGALDEQLRSIVEHLTRGEIVDVREGVKAVVIDDRRVVVAEAGPAPAGGFQADTMYSCQPYLGLIGRPGATPATAAPVPVDTDIGPNEPDEAHGQFCAAAIDALDPATLPADGAGLVEALRAIDLAGLDESDQRAFDGVVSALDSSLAAFNAGHGPDGWTTTDVADLVARLCATDVDGLTVMP